MREPVFFIDRSLGSTLLASMLRKESVEVRVHDELFPADSDDRDWLEAVAMHDWCVLTTDLRLRYEPLSKAAIIEGKLAVFEFSRGDRRAESQAQAFLRRKARIYDLSRNQRRPFVARITRFGVNVTHVR